MNGGVAGPGGGSFARAGVIPEVVGNIVAAPEAAPSFSRLRLDGCVGSPILICLPTFIHLILPGGTMQLLTCIAFKHQAEKFTSITIGLAPFRLSVIPKISMRFCLDRKAEFKALG